MLHGIALFDPRSAIVLAGVLALLMAVVLRLLQRGAPCALPGVGFWVAAPCISFTSTLLYATRGQIPDFLSVALANSVLFAGCLAAYGGSRQALGHPLSRRGLLTIGLAYSALMFALTALALPYGQRLNIITGLCSILFARHAWLFLRQRQRSFALLLMAFITTGQAVIVALRFIFSVSGRAGNDIFDPTALQSLYLSSFAISGLLFSTGNVLWVTEQIRGELARQAQTDELTGTLNRRAFMAALEQALINHRRQQPPELALLLIDVDHFKLVNDRYGHAVGDQVLHRICQRLGSQMRPGDLMARYGGEEFAVLLPGTSATRAQAIAQRLCDHIATSNQAGEPGPKLPLPTISIGVNAVTGPDDSLQALLSRADAALYRAKAEGRNRVSVH